MIPILYDRNETTFLSNGIGRLTDCVSCTVEEERNGTYECVFEYPITGRHYSDIKEGCIVYVTHDNTRIPQPFDIYRRTAPIDGVVTFYASHISYRLHDIVVNPFTAQSCSQALMGLEMNSLNYNPFNFWTDKTVTGEFVNPAPANIREKLCGEQGSILDVYGTGEYEFDKWDVKLHLNRGSDTDVTIRYGKNLVDITSEIDHSGLYNAVVPFWANEEGVLVTLPERYILAPQEVHVDVWTDEKGNHITNQAYTDLNFAYALVNRILIAWTDENGNVMTEENGVEFGFPFETMKMHALDLSDQFEEEPTADQLRERARAIFYGSRPWEPEHNIEVDFVQLWETSEFKQYAPLERLNLCDTANVIYNELGVNVRQKVIKTVYNVLLDRYDKMELGKARTTFADTLTDSFEGFVAENYSRKSAVADAIERATNLITGGLGGHVVIGMNEGVPNEILIMNTDDIATATLVLRINQNGIGFSHNGYDGPYETAWTLDGRFVADFITAGVLSADLIRAGLLTDATGRNYWNLETGDFRLASTTEIGDGSQTLEDLATKAGTVESVSVEYALSNNAETAPASGWSTGTPIWTEGEYIWQRTVTVDGNGNIIYSEPACIQGAKGADGEPGAQGATGPQGATGVGVSAVVPEYYLSTSDQTQAGGSWLTNQPTWESEKFIWTRSSVTWTNGSTTTTTPVLAKALNSANQTASDAQTAVTTLDNSLDTEGVFNRLTNNGTLQGLYMHNGELYMNASYIQAGTLSANLVRAGTIQSEDGLSYWNLDNGNFVTTSNQRSIRMIEGYLRIFDSASNQKGYVGTFYVQHQVNGSYVNTGATALGLVGQNVAIGLSRDGGGAYKIYLNDDDTGTTSPYGYTQKILFFGSELHSSSIDLTKNSNIHFLASNNTDYAFTLGKFSNTDNGVLALNTAQAFSVRYKNGDSYSNLLRFNVGYYSSYTYKQIIFDGTAQFLQAVYFGNDNQTTGGTTISGDATTLTLHGVKVAITGALSAIATALDVYGAGKFTGSVSGTSFINTSDERKKNFLSWDPAYDSLIDDLTPQLFKWKEGGDDKINIGFSAQKVKKALEDRGIINSGIVHEDEDGYLSLNYNSLTLLLFNRIKTQDAEIKQLNDRIATLERMVQDLCKSMNCPT